MWYAFGTVGDLSCSEWWLVGPQSLTLYSIPGWGRYKVLLYMGCHTVTALPLQCSCPQIYTIHLYTGTSETYLGSQPTMPGGGFVYCGLTHCKPVFNTKPLYHYSPTRQTLHIAMLVRRSISSKAACALWYRPFCISILHIFDLKHNVVTVNTAQCDII